MRVGLVLLVVATLSGCGEDVPDASISGVFPAIGFTNRQVRVQISGDISQWSDSASVDFGAGITVDGVRVASPTAIFADITIGNGAEIGLHDVTVVDRG